MEDFEKAHSFLEALGYQKLVYYEKYRTTYQLEDAFIMLDELPYGDFVEIEGETVEQIQVVAEKLNLNWDTTIGTSYTTLFDNVRHVLQLSFQDLSFEKQKNVMGNVHPPTRQRAEISARYRGIEP